WAAVQPGPAVPWCLVGHHRVAGPVEQHRRQPIEKRAGRVGERRARARRRLHRAGELVARQIQDEFPCGQVVEGTGVNPEQLRIAADLGEYGRLNLPAVAKQLLEQIPDVEIQCVSLVVVDIAAGERRAVEMHTRILSRSGNAAKPSAYTCTTAASPMRSR